MLFQILSLEIDKYMEKKKCIAIVLSAGSGKRMNSDIKKQYLLIKDKPIIYYSLKTFQDSNIIDEIVLVTSSEDMEYVKTDIVAKYDFSKVKCITAGGKERYNSVYNGMKAAGECDYIYIHDGARPFVTEEIIERAYNSLINYGSAVVGMPVKDTIKIVDEECFVSDTPNRKSVWQVQTPQCFEYKNAMNAYDRLIEEEKSGELINRGIQVTDDAMVVETFSMERGLSSVKLVEGSYENIKITTPEDLKIAEVFVS